jgi:hypothetical protein
MPYRTAEAAEPIARFPLRTPPAYLAVAAILWSMAAFVVGLLTWGIMVHGTPPLVVALLAVGIVILVVVWWVGSGAYRIGGGKGELLVYEDAIVIPCSRRGRVLRLPLVGIAFQRNALVSGISLGLLPIATFRRGELIILSSHGMTRTLSSLTSGEADFADRLGALVLSKAMPENRLEKLDAVFSQLLGGEAAHGTPSSAAPRSEDDAELDRRIDEELGRLD